MFGAAGSDQLICGISSQWAKCLHHLPIWFVVSDNHDVFMLSLLGQNVLL